MTETVAEALSRHEAACEVCKAGYSKRCLERETAKELADLRAELAVAQSTAAALLESVKHWERQCNDKCDALAAAEADRDRYLTRACVAEAKVAEVRELADSYVATPCHSGCGRPDYPGCTCNAGDFRKAGKAILAAIGGKP